MKKFSILLSALLLAALSVGTLHADQSLFNGSSLSNWKTHGKVSVANKILTLKGNKSGMVLKNGNYKDFEMTLELRSTPKGKGSIHFHTDALLKKGYAIAINNDRTDEIWWKMSGSLIDVRNLTKSFVKEDQWFKMNIRVFGQEIDVHINGTPVVEYIQPKAPYRAANHAKELLGNGTFAIESSGTGAIEIKNITVNKLNAQSADIEKQLADANDEQADPIIRLHQEDFPVLDYHVHLKGGLTKEQAAIQSRKLGINYAVAPNCGIGFPISTKEQVLAYLDSMRTQPFILAMQAEGREWMNTFGDAYKGFDYVFTDCMTYTDDNGNRTRSWIAKEVKIDDPEKYMDMILSRILGVLKEPVNIYVNPCYLPDAISKDYDKFWTEERMNTFIEAQKKSGKALEINELYKIPSKAILLKAKAAGVKFTFGSNNVTPNVSDLKYSLQMKKELGLTAKDMYKPQIKI